MVTPLDLLADPLISLLADAARDCAREGRDSPDDQIGNWFEDLTDDCEQLACLLDARGPFTAMDVRLAADVAQAGAMLCSWDNQNQEATLLSLLASRLLTSQQTTASADA